MIPEHVFEKVKTMLGPDEPLPVKFDGLYTAVKHKSDCLQGGRDLSAEMLALLLILSKQETKPTSEAPVKPASVPVAETVEPEEPVNDDPDSFAAGTPVNVFRDGIMQAGTVIGRNAEPDGRYRIKLNGDASPFRLVDARDVMLSEDD